MKKVQRRKIKQKLFVYCVLLFVGDIKNLECFILKNYILPREKLESDRNNASYYYLNRQ